MTIDQTELTRAVDDAVRAVPGVARLYPADAALVRSARTLLADGSLPMSSLDSGSLTVNVGVEASRVAAEVAAEVDAAARALVGVDALVRVRITRLV